MKATNVNLTALALALASTITMSGCSSRDTNNSPALPTISTTQSGEIVKPIETHPLGVVLPFETQTTVEPTQPPVVVLPEPTVTPVPIEPTVTPVPIEPTVPAINYLNYATYYNNDKDYVSTTYSDNKLNVYNVIKSTNGSITQKIVLDVDKYTAELYAKEFVVSAQRLERFDLSKFTNVLVSSTYSYYDGYNWVNDSVSREQDGSLRYYHETRQYTYNSDNTWSSENGTITINGEVYSTYYTEYIDSEHSRTVTQNRQDNGNMYTETFEKYYVKNSEGKEEFIELDTYAEGIYTGKKISNYEYNTDGTYIEHVFQYNEDVELIVLKDILYNSYGPLEYTFYTFDENGVHFAEKVSAQAMNSEIEKRYTKVYK